MGFQDMHDVVHRAASAKGGRVKTTKGLAAMSPEKRREVQSKGGKTSGNKRSKGAKQTQEGRGGSNSPTLADVLGNLDEEKL